MELNLATLLIIACLLIADVRHSRASPLTTQPVELANHQIGYATQTDQRKYLDVSDQLVRLTEIGEIGTTNLNSSLITKAS